MQYDDGEDNDKDNDDYDDDDLLKLLSLPCPPSEWEVWESKLEFTDWGRPDHHHDHHHDGVYHYDHDIWNIWNVHQSLVSVDPAPVQSLVEPGPGCEPFLFHLKKDIFSPLKRYFGQEYLERISEQRYSWTRSILHLCSNIWLTSFIHCTQNVKNMLQNPLQKGHHILFSKLSTRNFQPKTFENKKVLPHK